MSLYIFTVDIKHHIESTKYQEKSCSELFYKSSKSIYNCLEFSGKIKKCRHVDIRYYLGSVKFIT